jgi:hypothetical protein
MSESLRQQQRRVEIFDKLLTDEDVDLVELRKQSWTGIPPLYRAKVWQLLLGYLPTRKQRRNETIARKREDYLSSLPKYWQTGTTSTSTSSTPTSLLEEDQKNLRQILVDIPRTAPDLPLFHCEEVRRSMERILYIWSIRHPASGYVQGMNDLITPFYSCFLADRVCMGDLKATNEIDTGKLGLGLLEAIESDTYWCLTKLLDGIQDHYTSSQPGLQRMVYLLTSIVQRIDQPLFNHIQSNGLLFVQFSFRWMNCLLLRELNLSLIIRLWDTYLSEDSTGFASFHVYVCAALLVGFSDELKKMNLEEMIMFLQCLPTRDWQVDKAENLLSQAFVLQSLFDQSPAHLA